MSDVVESWSKGRRAAELDSEVERLRAEVDRLTDGIREHRRRIGHVPGTSRRAGALRDDFALWSLLDVAGDDGHEWVGIAGHPDDDECSLCGGLRPDHQFQGERPVSGDDTEAHR